MVLWIILLLMLFFGSGMEMKMYLQDKNIVDKIIEIIMQKVAIDKDAITLDSEFGDLGIDSMLMVDLVGNVNRDFLLDLSLTDIFVKYNSIAKLSNYILTNSQCIDEIKKNDKKEEVYFSSNDLLEIVNQQRKTMEIVFEKQLELLGRLTSTSPERKGISAIVAEKDSRIPRKQEREGEFIPFYKIEVSDNADINEKKLNLNEDIKECINDLRKNTIKSKMLAAEYRKALADADEVAGFNLRLKELQYQITVDYAYDAHIVDVDGNNYIDIAMGFGTLLFGHSPKFVMDALKEEIDRGMQLAPRHRLLGSVTEKLCLMTGFDRVTYTATGTEAVMTAVRVARCYTQKSKIVVFTGAYHGHSDMTLVCRTVNGETAPIAPGISENAILDTVVLKYNDLNSIKEIEEYADEIAAVLVEPVQSRRPDIVPKDFLIALRKITQQKNILLIFDEVITGFRCNMGGAHKYLGITPDLITYGKAICNGMPMGVVAGASIIMDSIDGGEWKYGDNSYPKKRQTYMGGTFFKHPFSLVAAKCTLTYMLKEGNKLQEGLTNKTSYLVNCLNKIFEEYKVGIRVYNFSSLFKFFPIEKNINMDIFYALLLHNGVFTWSGRTCFLSTAHTDEDIQGIVQAVKKVVKIMSVGTDDKLVKKDIKFQFSEEIPDDLFYS